MWSEISNDESQSSAKKVSFISFPEGLTNIRILDKEPHTRWQHWLPQAKRSVTCLGKGCPICNLVKQAKANGEESPYRTGKKHSLNVINRTTGKVEVLEQGKTFFEELLELHTDVGDVTTYDIKVKRKGKTKNDTKYKLTEDVHTELTPDELKMIEKDKIDLAEYFKAPTNEQVLQLINGIDPKEVFGSNTTNANDEDVDVQ